MKKMTKIVDYINKYDQNGHDKTMIELLKSYINTSWRSGVVFKEPVVINKFKRIIRGEEYRYNHHTNAYKVYLNGDITIEVSVYKFKQFARKFNYLF